MNNRGWIWVTGAIVVAFAGAACAQMEVESMSNVAAWQHVKSVWVPIALGAVAMLQLPLVFGWLVYQSWALVVEKGNDSCEEERHNVSDKELKEAVNARVGEVIDNGIGNELMQQLEERRLTVPGGRGFMYRFDESSEVTAAAVIRQAMSEAWESTVRESLEEPRSESLPMRRRGPISTWCDYDDMVRAWLLGGGISVLGALLGYALAFV